VRRPERDQDNPNPEVKKTGALGPRSTPSQSDAAYFLAGAAAFAGTAGAAGAAAICGGGTALPCAFMFAKYCAATRSSALACCCFAKSAAASALALASFAHPSTAAPAAAWPPRHRTTRPPAWPQGLHGSSSSLRFLPPFALLPHICLQVCHDAYCPVDSGAMLAGLFCSLTSLYQYSWCSLAHVSST